jgi:hypothetical protein
MTSLATNSFRATRPKMIAAATSLFLYAGLAQADTFTFTADGLFSTDLISFSLGVGPGNRVEDVNLTLPLNSTAPDFFQLESEGKRFDATLTASTPTEIFTYDFTGASVSSFTPDRGLAAVQVSFAAYTLTEHPAQMAAPEMDPASTGSALFLLTGGLAVLRGRRSGVLEPTDSKDQALSAASD